MQINRNLTWAPPRSPLRIEYSTELLREVLTASGSRDARGLLFGMRNGKDVWILAAKQLTGAAPVGIFVARIRGEVFLTESDLEFLETQQTDLALAVVGAKGGFFVREADGSIQTILSHLEFSIPGAPATMESDSQNSCQRLLPQHRLRSSETPACRSWPGYARWA